MTIEGSCGGTERQPQEICVPRMHPEKRQMGGKAYRVILGEKTYYRMNPSKPLLQAPESGIGLSKQAQWRNHAITFIPSKGALNLNALL